MNQWLLNRSSFQTILDRKPIFETKIFALCPTPTKRLESFPAQDYSNLMGAPVKNSVILSMLLFALSAMATPKTGDSVRMELDQQENGKLVKYNLFMEVTQILKDRAVVKTTVKSENRADEVSEENMAVKDMAYFENQKELESVCLQQGGNMTSVKVKEKDVAGCEVKPKGDRIVLGLVPFGLVEADVIKNSELAKIRMVDFTFASEL